MTESFPKLDDIDIAETRDVLHSYARVLGAWLVACRRRRKHWWHASLRPSLQGLTTGVVHSEIDFELELNLRENRLLGRTSGGGSLTEDLRGQPAAELADHIETFLVGNGLGARLVPQGIRNIENAERNSDYSSDHAYALGRVWNSVVSAMEAFRAGIREETSPIQLWPHHFDISMLWLPGDKLSDQDPNNEEYADKQMNFGFTLGDETVTEPYFYITAYPLPEQLPTVQLPVGTAWQAEGFSGAVLLYSDLIESSDPPAYLLDLWDRLLSAGRSHMLTNH